MRNLTPQMAAELAGPSVKPIVMADLVFDDQTLYMWTGYGDLEWAGNTYIGGGNLVGLSSVEETQNLEAKGLVCTLSGIPSDLVSLALSERTRGRPFRLWLASVDTRQYVANEETPGRILLEDGGGYILLESQLINSPYRFFTGLMDTMKFADNGKTATINLTVESSMIIGQRTKIGRYTSEDQKKKYPNDKGLDFINQLQDKQIVW